MLANRASVLAPLALAALAVGQSPAVLLDINQKPNGSGGTQGADVRELVDVAGRLFFVAFDGTEETLWVSDGTVAGTHAVVPSGPQRPSSVEYLTAVGDHVFFAGTTPAVGHELMVSDGTAAGTYAIDTNWNGDGNPASLMAAQDLLYFTSYNVTGGRSLWRTDGVQTVAISYQAGSGTIGQMHPLGRGLVFDFAHSSLGIGPEPWFTDGTVAGTVLLADATPGPMGSLSRHMAALGDRCFFGSAPIFAIDERLWVTDGTPAGTSDVFAGVPGMPIDVGRMQVVGEQLFFLGTDAGGEELWVTDGTIAGSHRVLDIVPGGISASIDHLVACDDLLLFRVSSPGLQGLWRSDGTTAGTFRLIDAPYWTTVSAGERFAWLSLDDGVHGIELWRTDGTVAGTTMYADLWPGATGSSPQAIALSAGRLFVAAEHPQLGTELWTLDLDATQQAVGYGCAPANGVAPVLRCNDPALGTTTTFDVWNGPALGLSVPLLSDHVTTSGPLGPTGCDLFLDASALIVGVELFVGGAASHALAIPATPSLDGMLFRVQVLTLVDTGVLELGLSNAVTLSLGN